MNSLEDAVLSKLLAGDDEVLEALRLQLAHATIKSRQMTGAGFYLNFSIPAAVEPIIATVPTIKSNFCFGDVAAHIDGLENGAGFLLWITDGRLDFLEGYTYDEPWLTPIENFHLQYFSEPRDMDSLRKSWFLDPH